MGTGSELREIWLIRSNFLGFSVNGQRSERSELNVDEILCEFHVIHGVSGQMEQILLDSLEFPRVLCWGKHLKQNV